MENHQHNHDSDGHERLSPARLQSFSDGVMAIIITITVLGIKVPQGADITNLKPLLPLFFTYLISFQTIGTYWNNHHHLLQATSHVSAGIMWANLHLLFWLSLIPFASGWLGESHGGTWPTVLYAAILLLSAAAYLLLQRAVLAHAKNKDQLAQEFSSDIKGKISFASYALAIIFAFIRPTISYILIILVAVIWFIPDRRIERNI